MYKQLEKTKRVWWHGVHVRDEEREGEREEESVCTRTPERERKSMHGQLDTDPSRFVRGHTAALQASFARVAQSRRGSVSGRTRPCPWLI